jgi:hypothetical protein
VIAYPATLPCVSRVEGHSETAYAGVVRTPMGAGNTRQRRAQRVLPHRLTLVFVVAQELYSDWVAWVNAHAFAEFVGLALPGLAAGRVGADTVTVPVRFVSDVRAELLPVHRLWYWRCSVDAEWLPTSADLLPIATGGWIVGGRPATPSAPNWIIAGGPATPSPGRILAGTPASPSGWL